MLRIPDLHGTLQVFCGQSEHTCVQLALNDLKSDCNKLFNCMPEVIRNYPLQGAAGIVAGTLDQPEFTDWLNRNQIDMGHIQNGWEQYCLRLYDDLLVIVGSDKRGTMWGIYTFCQEILGVDPMWLWTDHSPELTSPIIINELNRTDGPKTYRFRGWFINDEDLLEGFSKGGPTEKDYRFHHDFCRILPQVLETMLRLKQNLLIPSTYLDILRPEEEQLIDLITERGLYVSMHHQEPVGVSQMTIEQYWAARGVTGINYIDDTEKYLEVWDKYIHQWAKHEDVIWQLGLRGRGDRPVWYGSPRIPESDEDRGRLISDAIAKQLQLIQNTTGHERVLSTSTLWMEGMHLYRANALHFPQDTMVIQADFAPEQMWGEGYYTTPRLKGTDYGVYYHAGFWGCGPHLVQGNPPEKICFNYRHAVDKGDAAYSVLNVANIREMVLQIQCVSQITWDINTCDPIRLMHSWCRSEFGDAADAVEQLYRDYFDCFHHIHDTVLPGHMLLMDGMSRRVGLKMLKLLDGTPFHQEDIQNTRLFDFDNSATFVSYYLNATEAGEKRFLDLCTRLCAIRSAVPENRRRFYDANLVAQAQIMAGLYGWVHHIAQAIISPVHAAEQLDLAANLLEAACQARKCCLFGQWSHWYDGDRLMNLAELVNLTRDASHGRSITTDLYL